MMANKHGIRPSDTILCAITPSRRRNKKEASGRGKKGDDSTVCEVLPKEE